VGVSVVLLGVLFSLGSFWAFDRWDSPWWLIVGIAAVLFFGGAYLIGERGWDNVTDFCMPGLIINGVIFVFRFLSSAEGSGGWDLLDRPNWILLLYALVYRLLMVMRAGKETRSKRGS
jgi:hypothetical protein